MTQCKCFITPPYIYYTSSYSLHYHKGFQLRFHPEPMPSVCYKRNQGIFLCSQSIFVLLIQGCVLCIMISDIRSCVLAYYIDVITPTLGVQDRFTVVSVVVQQSFRIRSLMVGFCRLFADQSFIESRVDLFEDRISKIVHGCNHGVTNISSPLQVIIISHTQLQFHITLGIHLKIRGHYCSFFLHVVHFINHLTVLVFYCWEIRNCHH